METKATENLANESPEKIIIGGRKERISIDDVLNAVRLYKTTSPNLLAEKLQCERMTIYRKMKEIPQQKIDAIFTELSEQELKPSEMDWEIFEKLPEMVEFRSMLARNQVAPRYLETILRGVFHLCRYLKLRPKSIDKDRLNMLADLYLKMKSKQVLIPNMANESMYRKIVRAWCIYHGTSGEYLRARGIGGELGENYGKRALDRITMEQRKTFIQNLKELLRKQGYEKLIPVFISLVKWLFYTGTRITASLEVRIENITWTGIVTDIQTIGKIQVTDKGKHRKGRLKWIKLIAGGLKTAILENLEARGNPTSGLLFEGINYEIARITFKTAFEMSGITVHQPNHVWRHTASQELLDATDWNYGIVGALLGWKDTKTLKECYGEMGESVRERALKKAMGIPIEEKPKFFQFLAEDQPLTPILIPQ